MLPTRVGAHSGASSEQQAPGLKSSLPFTSSSLIRGQSSWRFNSFFPQPRDNMFFWIRTTRHWPAISQPGGQRACSAVLTPVWVAGFHPQVHSGLQGFTLKCIGFTLMCILGCRVSPSSAFWVAVFHPQMHMFATTSYRRLSPSFSSAGPHSLGSGRPLYPIVKSSGVPFLCSPFCRRGSGKPRSIKPHSSSLPQVAGSVLVHRVALSLPCPPFFSSALGIAHANPGLLNLHAWLLRALVIVGGLAGCGGHGLTGPSFWLSRGLLLTLVPLALLVPGRPGGSLLPLL